MTAPHRLGAEQESFLIISHPRTAEGHVGIMNLQRPSRFLSSNPGRAALSQTLRFSSPHVLTHHRVERGWQSHLVLADSGVQDAAGGHSRMGWRVSGWKLPTCTTAHGFTRPAGPCGGDYPQATRLAVRTTACTAPEGPFSDSTHCPLGRTGFTSAAEPQEECMFTLCTLQWVILIIKVQNILLRLEAKFLIQQHRRVAC